MAQGKYSYRISGPYPEPIEYDNYHLVKEKPVLHPLTETMNQISQNSSIDYNELLHIGKGTFYRQHLDYGPEPKRVLPLGTVLPLGGNPSNVQNNNPQGYQDYQTTQGQGTNGGGGTPPPWNQGGYWQQKYTSIKLEQAIMNRLRGYGGFRGSTSRNNPRGSGLQGANSIPNLRLGNVPAGATTTQQANPLVIILVLGALGVGGYLLYHKLHKAKAEEKEMGKKNE